MERLKLIMTSISLVFMILCLAVSLYFSYVLDYNDPNLTTFYGMDVILLLAVIWFAINVRNLAKGK